MPYKIRRSKKGGWDIIKKMTGEVVAHSDTMAKAKGTIYHRMKGEKKS